MNIRNGIDPLAQVLQTQTSATAAAPKSVPAAAEQTLAGDSAQVSNAGSQIAQSNSASDVRMDKVASIQSAIQAGTYHVPSAEVAQKVIASMISQDKQ